MYVEHINSKQGNRTYRQILLRESYRTPGEERSKVKHRTLLNLTKFDSVDVAAIEFALKNKKQIAELQKLAPKQVQRKQGKSVGADWLLYQVAQRLGITAALGTSRYAMLSLWMVFARLINQGSRLSAVRLAGEHMTCEFLGISDFSEDDLYDCLGWLDQNQSRIEKKLFAARHKDRVPKLFLYDVTSSYLEGSQNAYGMFGYNRDGKKGKQQIVVGLLTDNEGKPVTVEVFDGNTQDPKTVLSQIRKLASRFGCQRVTVVGDRGMIKSFQIKDLTEANFYYITAITKPQIERLLREGVFQMELFEEQVCEIDHEGIRFILRRNPTRAMEMAESRNNKLTALIHFAAEKTRYLAKHPRASREVAERSVIAKAKKLKIANWIEIKANDSSIDICIDEAAREELSKLDGCYVIKTDLPVEAADSQQVHDRYKDLANIEHSFRTIKTGHLEIRPVFVRNAAHTRAHVFTVMLAYLIRCELDSAWRDFDLTIEEGIQALSTLCTNEIRIANQKGAYLEVPEPRDSIALLFTACQVSPPSVLPRRSVQVATKMKLPSRRKKL